MSSASAIVELSASGRRYVQQDELLFAFYRMPDSTAKEVAKSPLLNWVDEAYASAPKRACDLSSERLAYVEVTGSRKCKVTGRVAFVYKCTARGVNHLKDKGFLRVERVDSGAAARAAEVGRASGRAALAEMRAKLQGG